MRVYPRREPHKSWKRCCDSSGCTSGADDITGAAARADAHDCFSPAVPCAIDYFAAVTFERWVGEVRVAVDEPLDTPSLRGHFLSIQSNTGLAM